MELNAKEIVELVFFMILIPAAVFFGLRRSKLSKRIGFTFSITVIVFVVAVVAVPNFIRPRMFVSTNACVNNLHWIQEAKRLWAEKNHKNPTNVPTMTDLFNEKNDLEFSKGTNYLSGVFKFPPRCPDGGNYILGAVNEEPKCSIGPPQHTLHPKSVIVQ
ncbi:MAG TPA: hypothetical protein VFC07_12140 [Verrucomicrobiae bacterium]|nr:hypothetical protein [Verrucomicrobiae bacterium]